MAQFAVALQKFVDRYHEYVPALGESAWITGELIVELEGIEDEENEEEDE